MENEKRLPRRFCLSKRGGHFLRPNPNQFPQARWALCLFVDTTYSEYQRPKLGGHQLKSASKLHYLLVDLVEARLLLLKKGVKLLLCSAQISSIEFIPSGLSEFTLCRNVGDPCVVTAQIRPRTPMEIDMKVCSLNTASHESPCGFPAVTPTRRIMEPLAAIAHNRTSSSDFPLWSI